jgi:hypothetical protein
MDSLEDLVLKADFIIIKEIWMLNWMLLYLNQIHKF